MMTPEEERLNLRLIETTASAVRLEERARIRRELLEWLERDAAEAGATPHYLLADSLRDALDRICPEENKEG